MAEAALVTAGLVCVEGACAVVPAAIGTVTVAPAVATAGVVVVAGAVFVGIANVVEKWFSWSTYYSVVFVCTTEVVRDTVERQHKEEY